MCLLTYSGTLWVMWNPPPSPLPNNRNICFIIYFSQRMSMMLFGYFIIIWMIFDIGSNYWHKLICFTALCSHYSMMSNILSCCILVLNLCMLVTCLIWSGKNRSIGGQIIQVPFYLHKESGFLRCAWFN